MASKTDTKPRTRRLAERRGRRRARRSSVKSDDPLYLQVVRALKDEIVSGVLSGRLATADRGGTVRAVFGQPLHRARGAAAAARGQSGVLAAGRGHDRRAAAPGRFLRPRGDVDQRPRRLRDRRPLCDRHHRDDRDRRQAVGADRASRAASNGSRCAAFATPKAANFRSAGPRSTSTGNLPPSAGCCSATRGPIFHLIEDLFGQSIVEVHQEIAAALISPALAGGLKVKAGTTALEVQRTYKLATGKIAQVAINTHPASRFRHSMTMRRVKG